MARPGPGTYKDGHVDSSPIKIVRGEGPDVSDSFGVMDDDCGKFIAESRSLLPQLVQKLEEAIEILTKIRDGKIQGPLRAQDFLKKMEEK